MKNLPLKGLTVLEFSQYLSGPSAGLRMADLGARVIKIERPKGGDACRQLAIKNLWADESSLLFHTINRNKESFAADLKNPDDLAWVKRLIKEADVVTHNFRPGVMEKVGLGYAAVKEINPKIIYAEISGYGKEGPWKDKPGQDLLLQSISGLAYTSGNAGDDPVPFGIAIADIICGAHLVQGILAALVRRKKNDVGALIEVSLLESLLDFQFELITTYYATQTPPGRSILNNGHSLLSAPYGIYETADGYIAIAMVSLDKLSEALGCEALEGFHQQDAFSERDEIKKILSGFLKQHSSSYWLRKLVDKGIWSMEVLDWQQMKDHAAYQILQMEQRIDVAGKEIITTRCPIRINEKKLFANKPAPKLGEHTNTIKAEVERKQSSSLKALNGNGNHSSKIANESLLTDLLVVDFSQFLSGPSAGLRLADMGARVIKVERKEIGDICRELYVSDVMIEGESTIFHAINRNKESYEVDLKNEDDLVKIKELIKSADVVLHNFRPGVMTRLGLDYDEVKKINPHIVYAEISGYGSEGPWKDLPGQDLLLQAASGLTWLSNNNEKMPTSMGVAVVDILAGVHAVQGILAALFRKENTAEGSLVQVSMFESILDFQFEVLTCFYNDGNALPVRSSVNNGHAYIAAPYGIYQTKSGYLALAMGNILFLADLLQCEELKNYPDQKDWFSKRDEIKTVLSNHLMNDTTEKWLSVLEPADVWCAKVLNYEELMKLEGYSVLNMELVTTTGIGVEVKTTRCPIRVDGKILASKAGAPFLGEHNDKIEQDFIYSRQAIPK